MRRGPRAGRDDGFTLIELLVVVVIIGILVAIAIPLYLNYRRGAQTKSAQSDLRNAVATVEACIVDNGGKVPSVPNPTNPPLTSLYSYSGQIYFTCKADGTGVATTTAPPVGTTADQVINVTAGSGVNYAPDPPTRTYVLEARYDSTPGARFFRFYSATGKTVVVSS